MTAAADAPLAPPPTPARRREAPPLLWRLQNLVGTYLPLLILALLRPRLDPDRTAIRWVKRLGFKP